MWSTLLLCSFAILRPSVASVLGSRAEAEEWFKSKVPEEVLEVSGELPASRSSFYVGGRYVEAVS
jgi:hypothetical protein